MAGISDMWSRTKTCRYILRIQVEVGPVDLIESPQKVLGGTVDIVSTRVIGEVVGQRTSCKFDFEQIHLVEEEDDTRSDEPTTVHHRVEQH